MIPHTDVLEQRRRPGRQNPSVAASEEPVIDWSLSRDASEMITLVPIGDAEHTIVKTPAPPLTEILGQEVEVVGSPPDDALFLQRAVKEAVHELGHTYVLGHCRNPKCIMFFSNTLDDTDVKGPGLCAACREKVDRGIRG